MQTELLPPRLEKTYAALLSQMDFDVFATDGDQYSGVFLPAPSAAYFSSSPKVMLVGRETAGWNTDNQRGTIKRLHAAYQNNELDGVIAESFTRYKKHVDALTADYGKPQRSHFRRFHYRVADHFGVTPDAVMYCNLLAWDYNKGSPLRRPGEEQSEIIRTSVRLLATQINAYQPDIIIFATGYSVDTIIKKLFSEAFNGWDTHHVLPRKLWQFSAASARCFRLAHPRATSHGHPATRDYLFTLF